MSITLVGPAPTITSQLPLPLFLSPVQAGFPSPAEDYIERSLDLNELCIVHPAATFFVRVEGDSMHDMGIYEDDILVVDRALEARHGDIIIACLDDEYTVKELCFKPLGLIAHNPAYPPIWLLENQQLGIFGVVTNVVRNLRR